MSPMDAEFYVKKKGRYFEDKKSETSSWELESSVCKWL